MSLYSGLSVRDIYTNRCHDLGCKVNSSLAKSLPETPDLFTIPVVLDLSNNFLGPRGLKPFFEVVRVCSELRVLNLSDQQMTNESITELCRVVKEHPSLTQISLSKNPLTIAAGMELVEMLKENKSLEVIALDGTDVKPTVLNVINNLLEKNIERKTGNAARDAAAAKSASDAAEAAAAAEAERLLAQGLLTQEIDAPAVRAALATIKKTVSTHKLFDESPYAVIRTLCNDFGKLFTDPHFPAEPQSVQRTEANEYYVTRKKWKRVVTMYHEQQQQQSQSQQQQQQAASPTSLSGGAPPSPAGDIFSPRQGEVIFPSAEDCHQKGFTWQFTALQALLPNNGSSSANRSNNNNTSGINSSSSSPNTPLAVALVPTLRSGTATMNYIRSLITPNTVNPLGFYVVKVFVDAQWRYVLVDDQLPVDTDGNLVFTGPATDPLSSAITSNNNTTTNPTSNLFWCAIYEKAMAKVYGSYQALDTTVPQSVKHTVLEKPPSPATLMKDASGGVGISRDIQHQQFDSREWWQTLLALPEEFTSIVTISSDADESRCLPAGVEPAHCYKVLQIRQINGFSLLQLHSSYAQRKYCDDWHDGSTNWNEYPLVADALGIAKKADSSFWIPYHRFLHLFKSMHICRTFPHSNTRAIQSEWTDLTAGGPYFGHFWGHNPHFRFTVTDRSSVFVNLALCDGRFKEEKEEVETLAFHLMKSPYYPLEFHADDVVGKTEYVITNAVSYEGMLPAGDYWLVPSSYTAAKKSKFWLRLFSTAPMVFAAEPEGKHWTARSAGCNLESAGEYQNGEDNAQVELRIPATQHGVSSFRIVVVLQATEASNDTNAVIFLVKPNAISASEQQQLTLQQQQQSQQGSSTANSPKDLDPNPRRFVGTIPDANIITKSPFIVGDRVCLEATIAVPEALHYKDQRYFIIPCLTPAKTRAKLNVTVYLSEPKFSVENLPLWPRRSIKASFHSTIVAPLQSLTASSPQIELCPHDADTHFIINMEAVGVTDPLIFFAVVVNDNGAGNAIPIPAGVDICKLPEGKVIAKSAYIRHSSVSLELKLPREVRQQSYIIVPYLQPPGAEGSCLITVSNKAGGFALRNLTQ